MPTPHPSSMIQTPALSWEDRGWKASNVFLNRALHTCQHFYLLNISNDVKIMWPRVTKDWQEPHSDVIKHSENHHPHLHRLSTVTNTPSAGNLHSCPSRMTQWQLLLPKQNPNNNAFNHMARKNLLCTDQNSGYLSCKAKLHSPSQKAISFQFGTVEYCSPRGIFSIHL